MKNLLYIIPIFFFASCGVNRQIPQSNKNVYQSEAFFQRFEKDPVLTKSLFDDKSSTISEENIQKILDGEYALPKNLRVAIVKLDNSRPNYYYRSNESYLKSQQAYLDLFTQSFDKSGRVERVTKLPDILLSSTPTFTNIRESAVRTQSDIAVIYAIHSDIYSKYKFLSKSDIKAFATTELIILDVRTGLIPFSTVVTKEYRSSREDGEIDDSEAVDRIKRKAVELTINEIGRQLNVFLSE